MIKPSNLLACLISLVLIACQGPHEPVSNTADLFDGKTLTGWHKVGGSGLFKVEDGCIVGYGTNIRGNTFLRTDQTYGDFELTYEFRFGDRAGNSGMMFRANQRAAADGNGRVFGYQCEGDNGHERSWTAGLYDEARRGWLAPQRNGEPGAAARAAFTDQGQRLFHWDDWNTIVIRCEGNHLQTWLNGGQRVDYIDVNGEHDTREGFFGLQVHQGKSSHVMWRNLKLEQL